MTEFASVQSFIKQYVVEKLESTRHSKGKISVGYLGTVV